MPAQPSALARTIWTRGYKKFLEIFVKIDWRKKSSQRWASHDLRFVWWHGTFGTQHVFFVFKTQQSVFEVRARHKKRRNYFLKWNRVKCPPLGCYQLGQKLLLKEFPSGLETMEIYDTDNGFEFDSWPRRGFRDSLPGCVGTLHCSLPSLDDLRDNKPIKL